MIWGGRTGRLNLIRQLAARTQVANLTAFVLPGLEIARAKGIDLASVRLRVAPTPRHANVLLLVGELPPGLLQAASVVYAQMPRPRSIVSLGSGTISPLPAPDATGELDQAGLVDAMAQLRRVYRSRAWSVNSTSFQAPALQDGAEEKDADPHAGHHGMSSHSMHSDPPGDPPMTHHSGSTMDLNETHAHDSMGSDTLVGETDHSDQSPSAHGAMDHGGDGEKPEEPNSENQMDAHGSPVDHALMTMVVSQNSGGAAATSTDGHETVHGSMMGGNRSSMKMDMSEGMDHGPQGGGFMSMVMMTQDQPRSLDGLPMEWLEVPFGPFLVGLPGGLALDFTLDGDAVAGVKTRSGMTCRSLKDTWDGPAASFPERLARVDPLAPVAYRVLAHVALDRAAGISPNIGTVHQRIGALELQRAVSHLSWLASLAALLGDRWLEDRAATLQRALLLARDIDDVRELRTAVIACVSRTERSPLIRRRLKNVGSVRVGGSTVLSGPVARAAGIAADARSDDPVYEALGFTPCVQFGNDAYARLQVRLEELKMSLALVVACGGFALLDLPCFAGDSGQAIATVEIPRGAATLAITLRGGSVAEVTLQAPSAGHFALVPAMIEELEVGDALIAVATLDLSPWEIDR